MFGRVCWPGGRSGPPLFCPLKPDRQATFTPRPAHLGSLPPPLSASPAPVSSFPAATSGGPSLGVHQKRAGSNPGSKGPGWRGGAPAAPAAAQQYQSRVWRSGGAIFWSRPDCKCASARHKVAERRLGLSAQVCLGAELGAASLQPSARRRGQPGLWREGPQPCALQPATQPQEDGAQGSAPWWPGPGRTPRLALWGGSCQSTWVAPRWPQVGATLSAPPGRGGRRCSQPSGPV